MTLDELLQKTHSAFNCYTRETGLQVNEENLQFRIHPDDYDAIITAGSSWYLALDSLFKEKGLLGIPVITDEDIQVGHPVIRSTWEWVL